MARAQQLANRGMRDQGRHILDELLAMGVEDLAVKEALPGLMVSLGRVEKALDCVANESGDAALVMRQKVADRAVLHFDDIPRSMQTYRSEAEAIRDAIDLLYQDKADQARVRLATIARQSPFSDWVFFVRGLAAYYAADCEKMHAYWGRLDPNRAAARMAEPLNWLAESANWHDTDSRLQRKLKQLEHRLTGHTVLPHLAEFRRRLGSEMNADAILPSLRAILIELQSADPATLQHVTRLVIARFVRMGNPEELDDAKRMLKPLLHDPNWKVALALAYEQSEREDDAEHALRHWKQYAAEIPRIKGLSADDRRVIFGLVNHHIATTVADLIDELRHCDCGESHAEEIAAAALHSLEYFERAADALPEYLPIYEDLAKLHEDAGRTDEAIAARERALRQDPDDLDSLRYVATACLTSVNPRRALECARRLRALQPLDPGHRRLMWSCHLETARQCALEGNFDAGRAEFQAADQLMPEQKDRGEVQARKVSFERAAGQELKSHDLIADMLEQLPEPTAFWLMLAIEFARYQLPEYEQLLYEKRWLEGLRGRRRATTMALMCATLDNETNSAKDREEPWGTMLNRYCQYLLPYVQRGGNLKWDADQLTSICWFLIQCGDESTLNRIAKKGVREFPNEPLFHASNAYAEFSKGPYRANLGKADHQIKLARQLFQGRNGPKDARLIAMIDSLAIAVDNSMKVRRMMPRGFIWPFDTDE